MIRGSAKFDGVTVGEASCSFLGATIHLEAKAAFVNTKTGDTHGWTKNTQWSPEVIAKLHELRMLMEMDLGRLHLHDGGEVLATSTAVALVSPDRPGGLGEHFNTPQV